MVLFINTVEGYEWKYFLFTCMFRIYCLLFQSLVYFLQKYIPLKLQSHGICILVQNKHVQ